ncbi:uncharacterized protein K460DRAFT_331441 [Cucurbitaria berberidis CBS 394.84]|uniref:BRCT domain-containing protein n=1 Tax=Cucurbitaria berberidis CBS 394.84 TaxID=1168544 RepID=A0A9P4GQF7_9PLEO|nr:uncharacterized protein K460DRAFT_331441 [Cucurbitaria berberidis CBS 394.84]KAF1849447.1 hypothetical protein K460DRAFT_331441 [Cucurbitaria berberidis CBS 394.84]
MSWTLLASPVAGAAGSHPFPLTNDAISHIVLTPNGSTRVGLVNHLLPGLHTELGRVSVGPWGAKLEAVDDSLGILSAQVLADPNADPRSEKYELKPRIGESSEVILLRHGDVISFSKYAARLTCRWTASEVQVNSSAADALAAEPADVNGDEEIPEEETEDENLDNTVVAGSTTQTKSPPPQLSNQPSVVVQETPTAARFKMVAEYANTPEDTSNHSEPTQPTPSPKGSDQAETRAEYFSTAHTGESQNKPPKKVANSGRELRVLSNAVATAHSDKSAAGLDDPSDNVSPHQSKSSPRVEIPTRLSRKRASSAVEYAPERGNEPLSRPSKRTKQTISSDCDTQDSRMSNIVVETSRKPAAKGKKRLSEVSEASEATPPRSQRSSQRSNTMTTAEPYEGPTPRVAFSHSAITPNSQGMKFLKKHKGAIVESINEKCNILCVRPGTLTKTMKLLESIARGIPIVTDKWLLDSAKAGHFLALHDYQPSVPNQEEDWKFELGKVWGKPQAPFQGYTIHFTPELRKSYADFKEIEHVCKAVGAKVVTKKPSKNDNLIVLAKEDRDKEAEKLMQDGTTCYSKDLLTNSILRGEVDLDSDEFMIKPEAPAAATTTTANQTKRKGRRKS